MNTAIFRKAARAAVCLSAAAAITLGLFSPVMASDRDVRSSSVKVSYADLNLSRPEDAALLYQRIVRAAKQVCRGNPGNRTFAELADFDRCRDEAIAKAVMDVGNGAVIALHRNKPSKSGRHG